MTLITINMTDDCCSTPGLKPFSQALDQIVSSITPLTDTVVISLDQSLDRILAEDLQSSSMQPLWHCSAMDGYALNYSHFQPNQTLTLVGSSFAGHPYSGTVNKGECIRIMTGACLPDDCDLVVMQENVTVEPITGQININLDPLLKQWKNVRQAGSEVSAGATLLTKGQRINPGNIGIIASLGLKEITVFRQLTIALFSTGDELVEPGGSLQSGQIFDSNRYAVAAACHRLGVNVIDYGLIEDDRDKIKAVMLEAAASADVLLTTGGVSVGEADFVKPILEEIGQIDLWKVAIKPGKPIAIGSINNCKFFGLPGNPISAMVTLNLLVQPAIQKLSGMTIEPPVMIKAISTSRLRKRPGRKEFQRGIANVNESGEWRVSTTGAQGSAKVTSLADGNCYIILDESSEGILVGDSVTIQLFDAMIR